jgi:hypothetical protein
MVDYIEIMEQITTALGLALGIKDIDADMDRGSVVYHKCPKSPEMLLKLYDDIRYRPFIDKFVEIGKVDRQKLGLPPAGVH